MCISIPNKQTAYAANCPPDSTGRLIICTRRLLSSVKCAEPPPSANGRVSNFSCPLAPWSLSYTSTAQETGNYKSGLQAVVDKLLRPNCLVYLYALLLLVLAGASAASWALAS